MPLLVLVGNAGGYQVALGLDATSNVLKAFTGGVAGTLIGTGTTGLGSDEWHTVELRAVIDGASGIVQAKANGNTEISVTGQDTDLGDGDVTSVLLGIPRTAAAGANGGTATLSMMISSCWTRPAAWPTHGRLGRVWRC